MFTVRGNGKTRTRNSKFEIRNSLGFTLLEIMLAVGILGLMSLAIFRFVQANMTALRLRNRLVWQRRAWTAYPLRAGRV